MDCSPPGSSVHGILQAKILEWVVISFSRGSSWPRDWTRVSCLAGGFFTTEPPRKASLSLFLVYLELFFAFLLCLFLQWNFYSIPSSFHSYAALFYKGALAGQCQEFIGARLPPFQLWVPLLLDWAAASSALFHLLSSDWPAMLSTEYLPC